MNLGATTVAGSGETCYGDYYAWGETEPYYATRTWDGTKWLFNTWKPDKGSGYAWQSYCGQSSFTEWTTKPYDDTSKNLTRTYDAATVNWGAAWRMPTGNEGEFKALYDACLNGSYDKTTNPSGASASVGKGVYWCISYDGVAGCLFCDGTNKLFFPAAGYVNGTYLNSAGSNGNYWSSSLYTGSTNYAYRLYFYSGNVNPQDYNDRRFGFSVRPVSD